MFERFTDRARRVVVLAQEEARLLNHNYIGTEHILLGLVHEGEDAAARSLERLGVDLDSVRLKVREIIGTGSQPPHGHIPFTPRAKKVLELSLREALDLGHDYIGTEHILLGLIREGEGVAAQVLRKLGVDLTAVRRDIEGVGGESGGERLPHARMAEVAPPPEAQTARLGGITPDHPGEGIEGFVRRYDTTLPTAAVLGLLSVLATLVAVLVERPVTGLSSAALIALLVGVIASVAGFGAYLVAPHRGLRWDGLARWSSLAAVVALAAGAVLAAFDALRG